MGSKKESFYPYKPKGKLKIKLGANPSFYNSDNSPKKLDGGVMSFDKNIGGIVKFIREREGTSQEKLGDMLGCTGSKISYIETGDRRLSVEEFLKFCYIFYIKPSKILHVISLVGLTPTQAMMKLRFYTYFLS